MPISKSVPGGQRAVGGAVAAVAMVDNAVANNHREAGESASDALAAGLSSASVLMAVWSVLGVALIALLARARRQTHPRAIDRVAAAAASTHTIPTAPVPAPHEMRIVA